MENSTPNATNELIDEVKSFYNQDFKSLFITFFSLPAGGLIPTFQQPSDKSFIHSVIILASVFVLYFAGSYILAGDYREVMTFSAFFSVALMPTLFLFAATTMAYLIKLIFLGSSTASFQQELLTGALCAIPILLFVPIVVLFALLSDGNALTLLANPMASSGLMFLILGYLFLMLVNVFQQSLLATGIKETLAWYLSPASIMIALGLSIAIVRELF